MKDTQAGSTRLNSASRTIFSIRTIINYDIHFFEEGFTMRNIVSNHWFFSFLSFVVIQLFMFPVAVFSQTESQDSLDHILNLIAIGGSSISYDIPYTERTALRISCDLTWQNDFENTETFYRYAPSFTIADTAEGEISANAFQVGLSLQHKYLLLKTNRVCWYLGIGPTIIYHQENSLGPYYPIYWMVESYVAIPSYTRETKLKSWGVGGLLTLGVEAALSHGVGILAEYQCSGVHFWESFNEENRYNGRLQNSAESTSKHWNFYMSSIRLGLAVHF